MIIIDFSQVFISNAVMQLQFQKNKQLETDLLRHMVLNSIRGYLTKFRSTYGGEIIIAVDSNHNWRKTVFPNYKAQRQNDRNESEIDWDNLYENLNLIAQELKDYSPYKVLKVDNCEADDIIAVITNNVNNNKILIISGDSDFIQLLKHDDVAIYNPIKKIMVAESNPEQYLKIKIIRGDKGDGVPNFLSVDNSFTDNIRQKSISEKKLAIWCEQDPYDFCDTGEKCRNWARNKMLIDFDEIPLDIQERIMNEYFETEVKNKRMLKTYFMEKKLVNLLESIQDF